MTDFDKIGSFLKNNLNAFNSKKGNHLFEELSYLHLIILLVTVAFFPLPL